MAQLNLSHLIQLSCLQTQVTTDQGYDAFSQIQDSLQNALLNQNKLQYVVTPTRQWNKELQPLFSHRDTNFTKIYGPKNIQFGLM